MIARLWLLIRFEWRKLLSRKLPIVAAICVLILALLAPKAGQVMDTAAALAQGKTAHVDLFANGWTALCSAVGSARFFLVLAVVVLAGSSVAEETSQGTLRAICLRPVRRWEFLLAKLLGLWSYAGALLIAVVIAAAFGAELDRGLYDVVDPSFPDRLVRAFGDMCGYVYLAVALTLPPLLALCALGLLVSVLVEHPGHATGIAVAALFALTAVSGMIDELRPWIFTDDLSAPFALVGDLAAQYTGTKSRLAIGALARGVWVPLLWTGACFGIAATVLERRDVLA
ncbi:MAG: ABC transporter permease [Planctomycetes bacterium]|nr:ABC transporter permease [Planctomycetota bacterium]